MSLGGRRVERCLGGLLWLVRVFTQPAHPGYITGFGRDSVPRRTPVESHPLAGQAAVARAFRTSSFFHRNPNFWPRWAGGMAVVAGQAAWALRVPAVEHGSVGPKPYSVTKSVCLHSLHKLLPSTSIL